MKLQEVENKIETIRSSAISIEKTTDRRIYLTCESEKILSLCRFLYEDMGCRFAIATGIDSDDFFEILYHFAHDKTGCVITIKALVRDKEHPCVESITELLPAAQWIERELHDVLGIEFRNHPDMRRLILADNWPEGVYPLRKERKS